MRRSLVVVSWSILLAACGGASRVASTTTAAPKSTIDRRVQAAAELALEGAGEPVDIIAMRASTGAVLAFTSRGGNLPTDDALTGKYPTGSVYKLVSTLALLEHGYGPDSPVGCPASVTTDGRVVTNFDGRSQTSATLEDAFVHSCNTAFATLGVRLPNAAFASAAAQLGLGAPNHLGRAAFTGSAFVPASAADRATLASDGGATVVSPLALATIAATIDSGSLHAAVRTTAASANPAQPIPSAALAVVRSMMAAAVASGTASGQGLPAGTHAKTGTAEFDGAPAPQTIYGWLVGYRDDIAFAVLVVGGTQGRPLAGPIAARFLAALA